LYHRNSSKATSCSGWAGVGKARPPCGEMAKEFHPRARTERTGWHSPQPGPRRLVLIQERARPCRMRAAFLQPACASPPRAHRFRPDEGWRPDARLERVVPLRFGVPASREQGLAEKRRPEISERNVSSFDANYFSCVPCPHSKAYLTRPIPMGRSPRQDVERIQPRSILPHHCSANLCVKSPVSVGTSMSLSQMATCPGPRKGEIDSTNSRKTVVSPTPICHETPNRTGV
jgi:hypothetical protein